MVRIRMQNKTRWYIFFRGLVIFVGGVELWNKFSQDGDLVYQSRILIDEDFSVGEVNNDEEVKSEKISLYTTFIPAPEPSPRFWLR